MPTRSGVIERGDAYALGVNASKPRVSAVIPSRNGATPREGLTYLELILPSLREQTFRDFDVTVVDNGSTDGSVAYLRERWPDVEDRRARREHRASPRR